MAENDVLGVFANNVAPFVVLAYLLYDASRRAERIVMAAMELMKHCDCVDGEPRIPSSGLSEAAQAARLTDTR